MNLFLIHPTHTPIPYNSSNPYPHPISTEMSTRRFDMYIPLYLIPSPMILFFFLYIYNNIKI